MRKFLILAVLLLIPVLAQAQTVNSPILDAITSNWSKFSPSTGVIYCAREHQVKSISSVTVAKFQAPKWSWAKVDLDIGYAPSDMLAGEIMYPLGNLSQFNISVPVLSQIDVNVGYGYGYLFNDSQRKNDGGPAITGTYKF